MRRAIVVCGILVVLFALGGFVQGHAEGNEENLSLGRGFGVGVEANMPYWNVPTGIFLEFCFSDSFALQLSCGDYGLSSLHSYFGGMVKYRLIDSGHLDFLVYLHGIFYFREGFITEDNLECTVIMTGLIAEYSITEHIAVNGSIGSGFRHGLGGDNLPNYGIGITYYFL